MLDMDEGAPAPRRSGRIGVTLMVLGAIIGVVIAGVALWPRGETADTGYVTLQPGDLAPAFTLDGADGRTYTLADLVSNQKSVLLYFSMGPG